MCCNNTGVSILLADANGKWIYINPDCGQWTCKECGPKKKAAKIEEADNILKKLPAVYFFAEKVSKARGTYFKLYRSCGNYLKITDGGIRYWFSDKEFSGGIFMEGEEAANFAKVTINKIHDPGQHVSFSKGWRELRERREVKYKCVGSGVKREAFIEASKKHAAQTKEYINAATACNVVDPYQFILDVNPSKKLCNSFKEALVCMYLSKCCISTYDGRVKTSAGLHFKDFDTEAEWINDSVIPKEGLRLRDKQKVSI